MDLPADRSPRGTWLTFCAAVVLALPQPPDPAHLALGAVGGALLIVLGFAAASRVRPMHARTPRQRIGLAALSLLAGTVLGGLLLAVLTAAARSEPALRGRFAGRAAEPAWRPLALAFESAILEEVTFRLFVMSIVAWLVARVTKRPPAIAIFAIAASTLLFALAHVPAWMAAGATPPFLIACVLLLNAIGGVLLSVLFWRWGLPYAVYGHFAGDMAIQTFGPKLLG